MAKGRIKNALFQIVDGFFSMGYIVTCFPTSYKNHATELILAHGKNYDLIACSGGDGTLNEVINGMLQMEKQLPLAYIPSGTVNDFAFNHCYFTYVAAFGAFTEVSYHTPQATKNTLGRIAYFLEGFKQLSKITTYHMRLTTSDRIIDDDFVFGAITNARSVAGFQTVNTKNARLDDGEFEVLLIRMPQNPLDLQIIISALLKQEINEKFMEFFTASSLHIESDPKASWTLDGEEGGSPEQIQIDIKNKAITFLV